jgi:hypothetical protein
MILRKRDSLDREIEEFENTPLEELLEGAEEVKINTPPGGVKSILSIRMDGDLLYELSEYARELDMGPTVLARELIKEGLVNRGRNLSLEELLDVAKLRARQELSTKNGGGTKQQKRKPAKEAATREKRAGKTTAVQAK